MEHDHKTVTKAYRNYLYNLISFLPFLFMLFSGLVVLRYHGGTAYEVKSLSLDGNQWLQIHRISALVIIPVIFIHLLFHLHWFKMLFTLHLKGKNSGINLTLLILFLSCALSGLLAWFVFDGKPLAEILREVHNKLGLLLIFFFFIHLSNYFKWIVRMTKNHFGKKSPN